MLGHPESRVMNIMNKKHRRMLMMIRGGTVRLRIETGRWRGEAREERICRECDLGKIEDVQHWIMRCPAGSYWRGKLKELMSSDWTGLSE